MDSSKKKQVFILSGQSNMSGRGGVHQHRWDGVVPQQCNPNPSILRLSAALRWEQAHVPLHADIDAKKTCGVGPGMIFANTLLSHLNCIGGSDADVIALVPCAIGGTAIKEWEKGTKLYDEMVKRAKYAVAAEEGNEIKAVLWYQGESDTRTDHDATAYKEKMEKLICDLRDDLRLPALPFIQVAIASGNVHHIEKVRKAQLSISLPNVVCIDAKGLQLQEDKLHLTTEAQVQLGEMLADAYVKHFLMS